MADLRELNVSRRHHRCTICGCLAPWSDAWSWYGSERELDDGRPVIKICGPSCRDGLSASVLSKVTRKLRVDRDFVLRPALGDVGSPAKPETSHG